NSPIRDGREEGDGTGTVAPDDSRVSPGRVGGTSGGWARVSAVWKAWGSRSAGEDEPDGTGGGGHPGGSGGGGGHGGRAGRGRGGGRGRDSLPTIADSRAGDRSSGGTSPMGTLGDGRLLVGDHGRQGDVSRSQKRGRSPLPAWGGERPEPANRARDRHLPVVD